MNDDWRLRVDLHREGLAEALSARLEARELEHDLKTSFHDRVLVSIDGSELFCYTGSREQAERAEQLIRSVAAEHDWELDFELRRWHPIAEEWRDPDEPLPTDEGALTAERAAQVADEHETEREQGYPDYEVRVQCQSHRDTAQLAEQLEREGLRYVRRWNFLVLGAEDEEAANALAERIRGEVPEGCVVTAEGTLREIVDELPPNPFSVMGGLGG